MRFAALILLAACLTCVGQVMPSARRIAAPMVVTAAAPSATYLVEQGFEGTGYDNGETWTEAGAGTINEDYTDTVLDGSQSLLMSTSGNVASSVETFSAVSEAWCYFLLQPVTFHSSTASIVTGRRTGGVIFQIRLESDGRMTALMTSAATTTATVSTGNTYHVWAHYVKGTGANAVLTLAFSSDGTKPTSGGAYVQITNSTQTNDLAEFMIGGTSTVTHAHIFDKIRVDDEEIGSNPE